MKDEKEARKVVLFGNSHVKTNQDARVLAEKQAPQVLFLEIEEVLKEVLKFTDCFEEKNKAEELNTITCGDILSYAQFTSYYHLDPRMKQKKRKGKRGTIKSQNKKFF
jgi:hypothetical protein